MNSMIIPLIFFLVIAGGIGLGVYTVKKKLEKASKMLFGTKSFLEGYNRQADELARTPKSVAGMTRIFEPQIQRDFPDFNIEEFKIKAEKMLSSALRAIDAENPELLMEGTEEVKSQISGRIAANQAENIREVYERIRIHRTEIARYEKKQGKCIITFQSAAEHIHYKMQNGKLIYGNDQRLEQTKYNMELLYIQDASLAEIDNAVGTTCPSCGAPVTKLGAMYCEYCGLAVTPVNIKVWSLHTFYEVDYNHV